MALIQIANPKMMREALCLLQHNPVPTQTLAAIQELINAIDIVRPLGRDGKHGERHTAFCGCEDKNGMEFCRWCNEEILWGTDLYARVGYLHVHNGLMVCGPNEPFTPMATLVTKE